MRLEVVVLPSVPVTPTTVNARLGWPNQAAWSQARAARPSVTVTVGTSMAGCARSTTTADSATSERICQVPAAVDADTLVSDKKSARGHLARV